MKKSDDMHLYDVCLGIECNLMVHNGDRNGSNAINNGDCMQSNGDFFGDGEMGKFYLER